MTPPLENMLTFETPATGFNIDKEMARLTKYRLRELDLAETRAPQWTSRHEVFAVHYQDQRALNVRKRPCPSTIPNDIKTQQPPALLTGGKHGVHLHGSVHECLHFKCNLCTLAGRDLKRNLKQVTKRAQRHRQLSCHEG
jgi:hypothetical protein